MTLYSIGRVARLRDALISGVLSLALVASFTPVPVLAQEEGFDTPQCAEGEVYSSEAEGCVPDEPEPPVIEEETEQEESPEEEVEEPAGQCVIVSDTLTTGDLGAAVEVSEPSEYWTADIDGATWIWSEDPTDPQNVTRTETFTRAFSLERMPASATLDIAVDDGYVVKINGTVIGSDSGTDDVNFDTAGQDTYSIDPSVFVSGHNVIEIKVTNIAWEPEAENLGGLLYNLTVEGSDCETIQDNPGGGGGGPVKRTKKGSSGSVLGAATECSALLTTYLGRSYANPADEVTKLQSFLNEREGASLEITGAFDAPTEAAVRAFQVKYWEEVLKPWFAFPEYGVLDSDDSTGIVYKTTKWKINNLACEGSESLPTLP